MRNLIIGLVVFLCACNQDSLTVQKVPYSDPALVQQVNDLTKALADATHNQAQMAQAISRFALIGKVHGQVNLAGTSVSFGPCVDMGIYRGQGGSDSANPLASQFEIYQQNGCTKATTSYNESTGLHDRLRFAAWDGPNCHGNMYVLTDVPQNTMSLDALKNILVIMSPDPSDNTVYASDAGSEPQPIQIQSAFSGIGLNCDPDVETRMGIAMHVNDVQVTGYPDSLVPGSWTKTAP